MKMRRIVLNFGSNACPGRRLYVSLFFQLAT
jgi:hypothetical protein